MSKSYLIKLPLTMFLTADQLARRGRLALSFDLLGILETERMNEILGKVLAGRGWTRSPDGQWVCRSSGGATWRIDPASHTLEVDISPHLTQDISLDSSRLGLYDDSPPSPIRISSAEDLPPDVRTSIEAILANLQAAEKDGLIKEAIQARLALTMALREVYREALQEKARAMGNIVSVSESTQDGTTRIRIEIS